MLDEQTENPRAMIARVLADHYRELAGTARKPPPRFSMRRALLQMAEGGLDDGYEKEVCGAAAVIAGGAHDRNRVVVPWAALAQRDATAAGSAGFLVGEATLSAADVLRGVQLQRKLGSRSFRAREKTYSCRASRKRQRGNGCRPKAWRLSSPTRY